MKVANWTDNAHRVLMFASEGVERVAVARANYITAWQLSLDGNLSAGLREEYIRQRRRAALELAVQFSRP